MGFRERMLATNEQGRYPLFTRLAQTQSDLYTTISIFNPAPGAYSEQRSKSKDDDFTSLVVARDEEPPFQQSSLASATQSAGGGNCEIFTSPSGSASVFFILACPEFVRTAGIAASLSYFVELSGKKT